jgi:hypothetical protein
MEVGSLTRPERVFAVIAKGDEALDWHEMSARYPDSNIKLLEGGDHALSDFETRTWTTSWRSSIRSEFREHRGWASPGRLPRPRGPHGGQAWGRAPSPHGTIPRHVCIV